VNSTLKAICNLVQNSDADTAISAVKVLVALKPKEESVYRELGLILSTTKNDDVIVAILEAFKQNPHEQTTKFLFNMLENETKYAEKIADVIVAIGAKSIPIIQDQFMRIASGVKRKLVLILPRIRTTQAHILLADALFSPDHELVRDTLHALRTEMNTYTSREKADLFICLEKAAQDNRIKNELTINAMLIAFGIIADVKIKPFLLQHVHHKKAASVRKNALLALSKLPMTTGRHDDLYDVLLQYIVETETEEFLKLMITAMLAAKPAKTHLVQLKSLLQSRSELIRVFAIQAIGSFDAPYTSQTILPYLHNPSPAIREAAKSALAKSKSAVEILLKAIDDATDTSHAFEFTRILESHPGSVTEELAKKMVKQMIELHDKNDLSYQVKRQALIHIKPEILKEEIISLADLAWKKRNFQRAKELLQLLGPNDLNDKEVQFRFAISLIHTGEHSVAKNARFADPGLDLLAGLLLIMPNEVRKRILEVQLLDPEDMFYIGHHFIEGQNEERRFGADLLRLLAKKYKDKKIGKNAASKLKTEGY